MDSISGHSTRFPKLPMFVLSLIVMSEPLSSTILLPFVYFMVRDFHITDDEKEIGYYAGLIASSFFCAQFCSAIWWGLLSDKFGRRPILLSGLLGNIVTLLMFGISKSLWWAIGSRALCGMLNGNVGVAKSMLPEITHPSNSSKVYSIFGFCWGIGFIVGPILGGFLSHPAEHFPDMFGNFKFLKEYPYFLPCFAGSIFSTISFFLGLLFLPESRRIPTECTDERQALLGHTDSHNDASVKNFWGVSATEFLSLACYSSLCLHSIFFEEIYPLFAAAEEGLKYNGSDIATTLSIMGVVTLISQFLIYPPLRRRVKLVSIYQFGTPLYIPVYNFFPVIIFFKHTLGSDENVVWWFLLGNMAIRYFLNVIVFTANVEMINNSASRDRLGIVNGIGQTCASFVRSIGPALGGTLWSWSLKNGLGYPFNYAFVFLVMSVVVLTGLKQSRSLPSSLNRSGFTSNDQLE